MGNAFGSWSRPKSHPTRFWPLPLVSTTGSHRKTLQRLSRSRSTGGISSAMTHEPTDWSSPARYGHSLCGDAPTPRRLGSCACLSRGASPLDVLHQRGALIGDADILIAATGLEHGLIVVTNNESHYNRITGIQLENWLA